MQADWQSAVGLLPLLRGNSRPSRELRPDTGRNEEQHAHPSPPPRLLHSPDERERAHSRGCPPQDEGGRRRGGLLESGAGHGPVARRRRARDGAGSCVGRNRRPGGDVRREYAHLPRGLPGPAPGPFGEGRGARPRDEGAFVAREVPGDVSGRAAIRKGEGRVLRPRLPQVCACVEIKLSRRVSTTAQP